MYRHHIHTDSTTDTKVHTLYTTGIFSHIVSILLVALYTTLDHDEILHFETIGVTIDREVVTHAVTILTLVLLYMSHTLRFAWLLRKEEMLGIIIVWIWVGNVLGDASPLLSTSHSPCDLMSSLGLHRNDLSPPPIVIATPNDTVIIASDVVNHHMVSPFSLHAVCGWNMFNLYFSVLCLFSVLVSFLCQTRNYCFAFFFKTLSLLSSVVIFFAPIACNRFHMTSTPVLILKITLYNIAWNMNRYMVATQGDISSNYVRGESIMRGYEDVYWPLINPSTLRRKSSRYYGEATDDEDDGVTDDDSDDMDSDGEMNEESYYFDEMTGYRKRNPQKIFKSLEKTHNTVRQVPTLQQLNEKQQRLRRRNEDPQQQQQQQQQVQQKQQRKGYDSMVSEENKIVTTQIQHFNELYRISRRFRPGWFPSWKESATYNDRLNDFTRTVWILAICPLYLFMVIPFLILVGYCIHRNLIEGIASKKPISAMESADPVK